MTQTCILPKRRIKENEQATTRGEMKGLRSTTALTPLAVDFHTPRYRPSRQSAWDGETVVQSIDKIDYALDADETGLVISNPMRLIPGGGIFVENSELNPEELRRAVLFWDKMVWPASKGIHIAGGIESAFLEDEGILSRPLFSVDGMADIGLLEAYVQSYEALERASPGQWVLSEASTGFLSEKESFEADRGVIAQLFAAVPVPHRDVPLESLLEFKNRRRDSFNRLRNEIDGFFQQWVNTEDRDHQLAMAVRQIEEACNECLRVARESPIPFSLSSWSIDFSMGGQDIVNGVLSGMAAKSFGMPTLGAAGLGFASSLTLGHALGQKKKALQKSPYNYAAKIETELW